MILFYYFDLLCSFQNLHASFTRRGILHFHLAFFILHLAIFQMKRDNERMRERGGGER